MGFSHSNNIVYTKILCSNYPELLITDDFSQKVSFNGILPTPNNFYQEFIEYKDIYACSTQEATKQKFIDFLNQYYADLMSVDLVETRNGCYFTNLTFKKTASKRVCITKMVNKFIKELNDPDSGFYNPPPLLFGNNTSKINAFLIREKRMLLGELFCTTFAQVSHIGFWRQIHWGTPFDVIESHYDKSKKELLLSTIDDASIVLNQLIQSHPDEYTILSQKNRLN